MARVAVWLSGFWAAPPSGCAYGGAFAGYERVMALYRHAIAQEYRFFSYGDAMLLERISE